jgi:hypothetical protein
MTTLMMTTLPTTTTQMQAVKGPQSPHNSPLREVTKTVIFQENVKILTPRRSPRKRKSIPQEIVVSSPMAENYSKPLLLTSITTTTSPRKRQIVENTSSSSLISQMAELMTLETPPNGLLKTPEADDTGDFVLEYQHPSILENTIQKVRIVYQKPLPPPLPPGKSILKKTSGKFTTSKSLAMATTTAKPSRNSNSNTNNNEHEEEAFTVQELNYRMSILFPEQHETLMQMVRTSMFGISSSRWMTTHTLLHCIAFRLYSPATWLDSLQVSRCIKMKNYNHYNNNSNHNYNYCNCNHSGHRKRNPLHGDGRSPWTARLQGFMRYNPSCH